ncbi:unnamed protein product [Boreogadus saida]
MYHCPMSLPMDLLFSYSPGIVDPSDGYCGFPLDFSNCLLAEICIVHPYFVRGMHMFTDLIDNDVRMLFLNIKDVGGGCAASSPLHTPPDLKDHPITPYSLLAMGSLTKVWALGQGRR